MVVMAVNIDGDGDLDVAPNVDAHTCPRRDRVSTLAGQVHVAVAVNVHRHDHDHVDEDGAAPSRSKVR
jgi:hypothetical protein